MTKFDFKKKIQYELFLDLAPSQQDMTKIKEMHSKGEIINPAITCKAITNYRACKNGTECRKLQYIVANCYLLGLSHQDLIDNAATVWAIIDGNNI